MFENRVVSDRVSCNNVTGAGCQVWKRVVSDVV